MEEWKQVDGTGGCIEVSNAGRVRSHRRGKYRILKTQTDKKGYQRIKFTVDRVDRSCKVHRLVAMAFIDNPYGYPQVNHIDGDKSNNKVSNLEWVTNSENARHAIANGLWDTVIAGSIKENERRMTPVIAEKDGKELYFRSVSEAERYFDSRHISDVLKGKRQHVKGWTFRREGR